MQRAGIANGDLVAFVTDTDPVPGDIVVARIHGELFLLRYAPPVLRTESEECEYQFDLNQDDVEILGVAISKITVTYFRT